MYIYAHNSHKLTQITINKNKINPKIRKLLTLVELLGHLRIITLMARKNKIHTSLGRELMRISAEEYVENEK